MQHKSVWQFFKLSRHPLEICLSYPGITRRIPVVANVRVPVDKQFTIRLLHQTQSHALASFNGVAIAISHFRHTLSTNHSTVDKGIAVLLANRRMTANLLVHEGLGLHRLLAFIVPTPPIAHEIDNHVFPIGHTVVSSQVRCEDYSFGIITVDVENRRLHKLSDLGAVFG